MSTVFWNSKGVTLIKYLQNVKTITGQYYADLLDSFNKYIEGKRPHMSMKKVIFHQDKAAAHSSAILAQTWSPMTLFFSQGKRFSSNFDIINVTNTYFVKFEKVILWRDKIVKTWLEKVYHYERRLYWNIKCILVCIVVFAIHSYGLIKLSLYTFIHINEC